MQKQNNKKSGESKGSAHADRDGAAPGGLVKPARLAQPTLDFQNGIWLNGKKDKIKGLECITVRFYPGGMQEVTYTVENDEGTLVEMGPSGLNALLRRKAREDEQANEVPQAVGYATKLLKRCFVEIPSDPPTVRKVQAGEFPAVAAKVMRWTQAEVADKGLNSPSAILHYWSKMDGATQARMDLFQQEVHPGAEPWSERVRRLCKEEVAAKVASEEKKAAKAAGIPPEEKKDGSTTSGKAGLSGGGGGKKPGLDVKSKATSASKPSTVTTVKWSEIEGDDKSKGGGGTHTGDPPGKDADVL